MRRIEIFKIFNQKQAIVFILYQSTEEKIIRISDKKDDDIDIG
jgi:hypothetical protein